MLLNRMPGQSAYREALLNDPEVAEEIAATTSTDGPPARPAWSTYTPERAALDNVVDRLAEVATAVAVAGGIKPPKYQHQPRPVTEVDRARLRREKQAHEDLVDEVKAAQERWERNLREARDAVSE